MADIKQIKLGNTLYIIKDEVARNRIDNIEGIVSSPLSLKGVISSLEQIINIIYSESPQTGDCYKIGVNIPYNATCILNGIEITNPFGPMESGDMIINIGISDGDPIFGNWTILQSNVDIFVGATDFSGGSSGLVPPPDHTGKFLCSNGKWEDPIVWGSISTLIPQG